MPSMTAVQGMLRTDALRMQRDRFLIGTMFYIIGISVVMRWAIPWIAAELAARISFDLTPYYPLIVSHILLQLAPMLGCILGGFLLLEGREDRTIKALLVSPVPFSAYLCVLCIVLFVGTTLLTLVEGAIIGIALPPWLALIGATLAAAPAGLAMAFFVAAFADNKIEAFAYMKFCGVAPLIPTASYFLPEPWQWITAIYPPYWASKAYWVAEADGNVWPFWVLGGLVTSAIWVLLMGRMFLKAARK